ncbi:MAG: carboxypeptidase-like regulatory domain-containing protein [Candidatus Woesearchaeota archaeon]
MRIEDFVLILIVLVLVGGGLLLVMFVTAPQPMQATQSFSGATYTIQETTLQTVQPQQCLADYYKNLYDSCRESMTDYYTPRYVYSYSRDYDEYDLLVIVRDEDGDRLEDAYVRVENSDYDSEYTDEDGEARFNKLKEDCYDIRATKSGYDAEEDRICLRDDETVRITLYRD